MAISKSAVDSAIRADVFTALNIDAIEGFVKINDRQYGILVTDKTGTIRYARVGVIVAEDREDITARELMTQEINAYQSKQAKKAETAKARAEKAAKDKAKREKEKG